MVTAAELPEDIVVMHILTKLSVKSLLRFRCVCKSWCSLISDSNFRRKNLNHNINMENEYDSAILFVLNGLDLTVTAVKIMEIITKEEGGKYESTCILKDLDFPAELRGNLIEVMGYCDGIVCLINGFYDLILWNPYVNEYKKLSLSEELYRGLNVYGIGYDPFNDDYKILSVPTNWDWNFPFRELDSPLIQISSVKSNSWRTIQENFPYIINHLQQSAFTNGRIHWVGKQINTEKKVIVYFDIVEEKFGEVPLHENMGYLDIVRIFGGKLCTVEEQEQECGSQLVFWVMKEYGVGESWTKLVTILQSDSSQIKQLIPFLIKYIQRFNTLSSFVNGRTDSLFYTANGVKSLVSPIHSCGSFGKLI